MTGKNETDILDKRFYENEVGMVDIFLIAIIVTAVFFCLRKEIRKIRNKQFCAGCSGCSSCEGCEKQGEIPSGTKSKKED